MSLSGAAQQVTTTDSAKLISPLRPFLFHKGSNGLVQVPLPFRVCPVSVRGVSWSEVATVPKRKSHRGLDLDLSLNSEEDIWKGRKESGGTK